MIVRRSKFSDIIDMWPLMQRAHNRSKYAKTVTLQEKLFKTTCISCMQGHSEKVNVSCSFVFEDDGEIKGFILGLTDDIYHFGKEKYATDIVFYVDEDANAKAAVKLMKAFLDWAEQARDVIEIRMGATDVISDYSRTETLYKHYGLTQEGVLYSKENVL